MNQNELQRLHDLAKIASERQLYQPERYEMAALAKQSVQMIIGQSRRIAELKGDRQSSSVPDFLRGLFR